MGDGKDAEKGAGKEECGKGGDGVGRLFECGGEEIWKRVEWKEEEEWEDGAAEWLAGIEVVID